MSDFFFFNLIMSLGLGWAIIAVFYHFALRPILVDEFRYSLFKIRDELRMLAIEGKIDPHKDFAYDYLEKRLCLCVGIIPEITPARFIHFAMSSASNIEAPYESKRFAESASPQLKKLWNEAVKQIGMGIIVNSILIVFPVAAIVIVHHWLEWARYLQGNWIAKKFKKITKAFVEQEMIEVGGKLLPA